MHTQRLKITILENTEDITEDVEYGDVMIRDELNKDVCFAYDVLLRDSNQRYATTEDVVKQSEFSGRLES